jgi:hypothetical protein
MLSAWHRIFTPAGSRVAVLVLLPLVTASCFGGSSATAPRVSMHQVAVSLNGSGLPQLSTRAGAFDQANVAPKSLRAAELGQVSGFCNGDQLFQVDIFRTPAAAKLDLFRIPPAAETGHPFKARVHKNLLIFDTCRPANTKAEAAVTKL